VQRDECSDHLDSVAGPYALLSIGSVADADALGDPRAVVTYRRP